MQYTAKYYKKTHPLCDYIGTYRNISEQTTPASGQVVLIINNPAPPIENEEDLTE